MGFFSSAAKRGSVLLPPLVLCFSSVFAQLENSKPVFQIRKLAAVQLDFGKEKVSGPVDFRVGLNGNIYLLHYSSGKLFRMDSTGKIVRSVTAVGSFYPTEAGFTVSREGDLFVADSREKVIQRYDSGLDLIGRLKLAGSEEFENIYDFLAVAWGDLFLSCGKKPQLWRLEPAGESFAFKETGTGEPQFYFSLAELPDRKLAAYDNFNRKLVFLDRFGNRVKEVPSRPVIQLGGTPIGLVCATFSEDSISFLDSNGYAAVSFAPRQLALGLEKIKNFVTVGKKIYLLGEAGKIEVLEVTGLENPAAESK